MITLSDITHHATLLVHSDRKAISQTLWDELRNNSRAHTFFETTVLDIDTVRSIQSWAATPYDERMIGLVSFHTITVPAHNSLLKILEEPPHGVHFVFITSNKEALLPTLLSRMNELHHSENDSLVQDAAGLFLNTKPTERMKLKQVTELLSKVDEHDRKDRESVRAFILDIATLLRARGLQGKYINECIELASYAGLPSSSTKALLEYLSLLLPKA